MNLHGFLEPDMLQSANPAMIMLMIPIFTALVYPWFARGDAPVRALSKMRVGKFTIGLAFVAVAIIQTLITRGYYLSAFWMLVPYLLLTISEVLVSITGLEFAYTQAPRAVKSTVMGMFYLTISFGNLLAAFVASANFLDGAEKFLFWAAAVAVLGLVFIALTRNYRLAEYVED
jgi:POT family proton-dependent oligopeptide transporter